MVIEENMTMDCNNHAGFSDANKLCRSAALFLLSAKERFQLTQSALDFITQQVKQMISFTIDDVEEKIKKQLVDQGIELDICKCFEAVRNPFIHLETEYMQNKFYEENFNLIVSFATFWHMFYNILVYIFRLWFYRSL